MTHAQVQRKLMALLQDQGSVPLRYREIGRRIGEKYPQTVKHHLEALKKKGMIVEQNGFLKLPEVDVTGAMFLNIPFFGLASCGEATAFVEEGVEGYMKISRKVFPRRKIEDFYVVRASGNSMNKAMVGPDKQGIEDGDFVIVDSTVKDPSDGDYIVSVVGNCANIKRFRYDEASQVVTLVAESTDEYLPITIHREDDWHVMGKVINVIKG